MAAAFGMLHHSLSTPFMVFGVTYDLALRLSIIDLIFYPTKVNSVV